MIPVSDYISFLIIKSYFYEIEKINIHMDFCLHNDSMCKYSKFDGMFL